MRVPSSHGIRGPLIEMGRRGCLFLLSTCALLLGMREAGAQQISRYTRDTGNINFVTTGGSALKAIARVREHVLKVAIILGIVDREEGGREILEKEAPLVTLFRKRDFVG